MNKRYFYLLLLISGFLSAQNTPQKQLTNDELMEWFREAKFGMFIHFGAETPDRLKNSNLTRTQKYEAAVKEFNPTELDAKEWVRIAKEAGMKYIVITTKHHDGFCLWDSKLTNWDVIDQTGFKRDIVAELAQACKEAGIELGFYYSVADWHHPEYDTAFSNRNGVHYNPNPKADITKYTQFMYGQITELCENYQPKLFWFDGSAGFRNADKKRILGQQEMMELVNSYGAISNSRYGDDDTLKYVNYLSLGDNMAPSANLGFDFETAQTMNDSWHFEENDHKWKSAKAMIIRLVDIAGKGGNYLLNVGPNRQGVIPEESQTRLKEMGDWLKKNGSAIYGTQAGPYPYDLNWGSITQRKDGKNTILYLNVVDWPKDGQLKLYGLHNNVLKASLLVNNESLTHNSKYNAAAGLNVITINLPKRAIDEFVSVIAVTIEGMPMQDQVFIQQNNGVVILDGYRATIHDKEFIPNKPLRAVDQKTFTVLKGGNGILPTRGMTVGLREVGEAISWDFKIVEPGTYKVAVVYNVVEHKGPKLEGRMSATVAGQTVENKLIEQERSTNTRMATDVKSVVAILGKVKINSAGMQTLSLDVTANFGTSMPNISSVQLLPVK